MKSLKNYTIVIRPDDNGTFVAYIPAIPGGHAWGKKPDEAVAELQNVLAMIREEYAEQGRLASDLERVARKLGFEKTRQKGSHARWQHPDGRATTIPIHANAEIGSWLFLQFSNRWALPIEQMGITDRGHRASLLPNARCPMPHSSFPIPR